MHEDLRRRALESRKTVSKKAQSKQASAASSAANSRTNSPATSRTNSRVGSRNASDDDETGYLSDETSCGNNSIDVLIAGVEDEPMFSWKEELASRIESILSRKRLGVHGREEDLLVYVHLLRNHFAGGEVSFKTAALVTSFLKTSNTETKETIPALKALAVTALTDRSGDVYKASAPALMTIISNAESCKTKAEAIHALATIAVFGDVHEENVEDIMVFLLEIIESCGNAIPEADGETVDNEVVTAALEAYGLLATQVEDLSESSQAALEILVTCMEGLSSKAQIAAGECIALLYEKSYTDVESDDEVSESDDPDQPPPAKLKRYEPYRRKDQLLGQLGEIANVSSKRVSKKDRKSLHTHFADILQTVENPTLGPRYSKAIDEETNKEYGSRMSIKLARTSPALRIDEWWKLLRLKALRRVLQGGFLEHYQKNEAVYTYLPRF